MDKTRFNLKASQPVVDLLQANPGLSFSAADLDKAQKGTLIVAGAHKPPIPPAYWRKGCISALRYQKESNDLVRIVVGGTPYTSSQIKNLNDFRDRLQEAANFGHEISFCFFPTDKKMTMLNIYPCGCQCKCEHDHGKDLPR